MPHLYIILAFILDIIAGDPPSLPHPVRLIGGAVGGFDRAFNTGGVRAARDRAMGVVLVVVITSLTFLISYALLALAHEYIGTLGLTALSVYMAYTTISVKGLGRAGLDVLKPLEAGDIPAARAALSMVVGRDTGSLDQPEIARGAVETVAENTSDGIVAPLMYLAIGGPPLALAYKAINTMDSMVGYRSERYSSFGWAAARLDDIANFVPARMTGLLVVCASCLLSMLPGGSGYSWRGAWRIMLRDSGNHSSPNSGYPEAAAAGALGLRLGGENSYFGVKSVKPFIGDPVEPMAPAKIRDAVRLMYATSVFALVAAVMIAYLVGKCT